MYRGEETSWTWSVKPGGGVNKSTESGSQRRGVDEDVSVMSRNYCHARIGDGWKRTYYMSESPKPFAKAGDLVQFNIGKCRSGIGRTDECWPLHSNHSQSGTPLCMKYDISQGGSALE